jgi:hypothetical protein
MGYWWGSGDLSRNMTIPRQLSLGEGNGQIKGKAQPKPRPVSPGRPRRELDVELLRELRGKGYGYKRIAGEYTQGRRGVHQPYHCEGAIKGFKLVAGIIYLPMMSLMP